MNLLNHNGLDVETKEEVDAAHKIVMEQAEKWKITKISKPYLQHGTYSFFFWDADDNCWEILTNPEGGYRWLFEPGRPDGQGPSRPQVQAPRREHLASLPLRGEGAPVAASELCRR